jgi:hypothetical protein
MTGTPMPTAVLVVGQGEIDGDMVLENADIRM